MVEHKLPFLGTIFLFLGKWNLAEISAPAFECRISEEQVLRSSTHTPGGAGKKKPRKGKKHEYRRRKDQRRVMAHGRRSDCDRNPSIEHSIFRKHSKKSFSGFPYGSGML